METLLRMNDIGAALFREHVREAADLLILPDVGHVEWFDFTSAEAMVEAGRSATHAALVEYIGPANWLTRLFGQFPAVAGNEAVAINGTRAD